MNIFYALKGKCWCVCTCVKTEEIIKPPKLGLIWLSSICLRIFQRTKAAKEENLGSNGNTRQLVTWRWRSTIICNILPLLCFWCNKRRVQEILNRGWDLFVLVFFSFTTKTFKAMVLTQKLFSMSYQYQRHKDHSAIHSLCLVLQKHTVYFQLQP